MSRARNLRGRNFNPRSPRGERPSLNAKVPLCLSISIHAPREGSDTAAVRQYFSAQLFQSTLPARGATPNCGRCERHRGHFNPRSPRGERPHHHRVQPVAMRISIHAPREGSDGSSMPRTLCSRKFQSTLPARGATSRRSDFRRKQKISIHAPREGSDIRHTTTRYIPIYFNPRSPRGERPR